MDAYLKLAQEKFAETSALVQARYVKEVQPLIREHFEVLFQNDNAVKPVYWQPTGDWYGDMFTAWKASWNGTIHPLNDTHWEFGNKDKLSCAFQQTWQLAPELKELGLYDGPLYADATFDGSPLSAYMRTYYEIPLIAVTLYMVVVFGGRMLMHFLPPFELKIPLFFWNIGLSLFSWIGVIRVAPHLLATIRKHGLYYSVCEDVCHTFGPGHAGLWSFLFIISKFPELVDTVFIVLRKKPLIFLHWYHHVTVLLYCWQAYATQTGAGIYFIAMNYTVHAIMYMYYGLQVYRLWPRFIPSWIITILQLSQMILGIAVCLLTYMYQQQNLPCSIHPVSFTSGVVMYFTYFLLFLQILFTLLRPKKKKQPVSQSKKKN